MFHDYLSDVPQFGSSTLTLADFAKYHPKIKSTLSCNFFQIILTKIKKEGLFTLNFFHHCKSEICLNNHEISYVKQFKSLKGTSLTDNFEPK